MQRDAQAGLSLIEVLIGLVILGVATSAVVLAVNATGRDRRAEDEAVRLVVHLNMAVEEGLVSRTPLAMVWTPDSYRFERRGGAGWMAAATSRLATPHRLPAPLALRRMDGASDPVAVGEDGLGPAVDLELSGAGAVWVVAFDGYSATARPVAVP